MSGRFVNFDELWAEQESAASPPSMRLFGATVQLPDSLPVAVRLLMVRVTEEGGAVFDWANVRRYLAYIFGGETVDDWIERGISENRLTDVARFAIFDAYRDEETPDVEGDESAGEAPAPETGA